MPVLLRGPLTYSADFVGNPPTDVWAGRRSIARIVSYAGHRASAALSDDQLETDIDAALAARIKHQLCGRAADPRTIDVDRAERRRDKTAEFEIAQTNHRHLLRDAPPRPDGAETGDQPDRERVIGGEYCVGVGKRRDCCLTCSRITLKHETLRPRQSAANRLVPIPKAVQRC